LEELQKGKERKVGVVSVPGRSWVVNVEESEPVLRHGFHDALSQTPFHSTSVLVL
jgi:hypothetical protein